MPLKALKIPFRFLITGLLWAIFSDPLISVFTKSLNPNTQDIIRSLNDFIFVSIIAVILYFAIKNQHDKLAVSEEQYRNLFESNPNPMWIYNGNDLRFVKVNDAAVQLYGYSESEFLAMTILDIRPREEHDKLLNRLKQMGEGGRNTGNWNHLKKDGTQLFISVESINVRFNKSPCRLVMATNNTELVLQQQKIIAQSKTLREIAWSNSHEVRRSICSVISLVDLLKNADNEEDKRELILMLEKCSTELDDVSKLTNKKMEILEGIS